MQRERNRYARAIIVVAVCGLLGACSGSKHAAAPPRQKLRLERAHCDFPAGTRPARCERGYWRCSARSSRPIPVCTGTRRRVRVDGRNDHRDRRRRVRVDRRRCTQILRTAVERGRVLPAGPRVHARRRGQRAPALGNRRPGQVRALPLQPALRADRRSRGGEIAQNACRGRAALRSIPRRIHRGVRLQRPRQVGVQDQDRGRPRNGWRHGSDRGRRRAPLLDHPRRLAARPLARATIQVAGSGNAPWPPRACP